VFVALGTDVEILFEVFLPDDLAASFALYPESFGLNLLLA
jgi:hypothetical protein